MDEVDRTKNRSTGRPILRGRHLRRNSALGALIIGLPPHFYPIFARLHVYFPEYAKLKGSESSRPLWYQLGSIDFLNRDWRIRYGAG